MRPDPHLHRLLSHADDYRNVAAIVLSLSLTQAAAGTLSVVCVLALVSAGMSSAAVGLVVAAYSVGFLAGARISPIIISRLGHIRSFACLAAVEATLALLLYVRIEPAYWTFVQAGLGACVAGLLATGESWVTDAAPRERRGAILGFYLIASKLGAVSGPLFIAIARPSLAGGFMVVSAIMAMSLVPVAATRRLQPQQATTTPFGPTRLWREAPAAVISAFVAGLVNGSILQLYPVFAAQFLPERPWGAAAAFNGAMVAGSLVMQWPAGHVSDRVDRRLVILALAILAVSAASLLAAVPYDTPFLLVLGLAALWGAGGLSFYGVAVAHAADRAAPGEATSMMSGVLMIWGAGAVVGPLVAGTMMELPIGPRGLFVMAAAALSILIVAIARRRVVSSPPVPEEKLPFSPALATSLAAAQLDPRADSEQQLELFSSSSSPPPS